MLHLVLGGTRSGKSARAEQAVAATGLPVVYVATAAVPGLPDPDFDRRVAAHRARRPAGWTVSETADIPGALASAPDHAVLVDDLGGWVCARLDAMGAWDRAVQALAEPLAELVAALEAHPGDVVLVSPEVGWGVLPATEAGRVFADVLGTVNRRLAAVCDRVELVVAGRVLELPAGSLPVDAAPGEDPADDPARDPAEDTTKAPDGTPDEIPAAPDTARPDDFPGLHDVRWYEDPVVFPPIPVPSRDRLAQARARQLELTKPPGSLGRLEELGNWIASCRDSCPPEPLERVRVVVFAGDHGIAGHGVSAFPPEVTVQMVANIAAGGAAVSVLARAAGATVRVADMAVASPCPGDHDDHKIRLGSGSIDREDALGAEEVRAAIAAGRRIADEEIDGGADLLIAGDLGIGNTTPATVLVALVTGSEPVAVVGRGTGVDDQGWMRKTAAVRDAMFRCRHDLRDPVALLRRAGGADLAAMTGFLAQAALRRTPCLLDGSVVTSAALLAESLAPGARSWWRAAHRGAEPSHSRALAHLGLDPILDFGMRLGEGSGAVAALPHLHAATAILGQMATFADAGVSGKD